MLNKATPHSSRDGHERKLPAMSIKDNAESSDEEQQPIAYLPAESDYSQFISNAVRSVPETTFNFMHGRLRDIKSEIGVQVGLKSSLGTLEKVKLNVSEFWSTKDVWESGAWEVGKDLLSWHKYEGGRKDNRNFLQRMSNLSWPQQREFKSVYDQGVAYKTNKNNRKRLYSSSSDSESRSPRKDAKKICLPTSLGMKQQGRSVKYMTASEREKRRLSMKEEIKVRFEGELNGEWETDHLFMCSVCAETYDELREVMHHKWDSHPYCLVTHITLQEKLNLPPCYSLYPQLGRSLRSVEEVSSSQKRRRMSKSHHSYIQQSHLSKDSLAMKCSKCELNFSEKSEFHKHVIECGGDVNWNEPSKKKSKKKKKLFKKWELKQKD